MNTKTNFEFEVKNHLRIANAYIEISNECTPNSHGVEYWNGLAIGELNEAGLKNELMKIQDLN